MTDEHATLTVSLSVLLGLGSIAGVLVGLFAPLGGSLAIVGFVALPFIAAAALVAHAILLDVRTQGEEVSV